MCFDFLFGGNDDDEATRIAELRRAEEMKRQEDVDFAINNINDAFAGFDDTWYNDRAEAYTDYSLPQLEDQYADARNKLALTLSRNNQANSSTMGKELGRLSKFYNQQKNQYVDKGREYANTARGSVERARGDLYNQAQATADPNLVANNANRQMASLSVLPAFDPIANGFTNLINNVSNAAVAHRLSPGGARNSFVQDIFKNNSGRVVG